MDGPCACAYFNNLPVSVTFPKVFAEDDKIVELIYPEKKLRA
jgi:hypothetical protein